MPTLDDVILVLGYVNVTAFLLIALGDFLVFSIDKITSITLSKRDDVWALRIDLWWSGIKEIYEQFRALTDRISTYSRPRK